MALGWNGFYSFNQVWLFDFFGFVTGGILLFQAWFKRRSLSFFGGALLLI